MDPVSRLHSRFKAVEVLLTRRETLGDQPRVPEPPRPDEGDHLTTVSIVGENGSSIAGSPVSPTAIPPVTMAQNRVIQKATHW